MLWSRDVGYKSLGHRVGYKEVMPSSGWNYTRQREGNLWSLQWEDCLCFTSLHSLSSRQNLTEWRYSDTSLMSRAVPLLDVNISIYWAEILLRLVPACHSLRCLHSLLSEKHEWDRASSSTAGFGTDLLHWHVSIVLIPSDFLGILS